MSEPSQPTGQGEDVPLGVTGEALAASQVVNDWGCPSCGYDGPHPIIDRESMTVECGSCMCEFDA